MVVMNEQQNIVLLFSQLGIDQLVVRYLGILVIHYKFFVPCLSKIGNDQLV